MEAFQFQYLVRLICLTLLVGISHVADAAVLPEGFAEELIAEGLDPTRIKVAPDGRIFIAEKNGVIRILRDGSLLEDPFVSLEVDNFNERGLAGMAFHPDFEQNNWIYVYYTQIGENRNVVSRLKANGDFAIPGSEEIIWTCDRMPGTIHNSGELLFDRDGYLYIMVGDGADRETPQSLESDLGKVLRIRDDGSIPDDNPFFTETTGKYRSIYALGLRNPFSAAISHDGKLLVCDVGGQDWEEVNQIEAGANYGWPIIEGALTDETPPLNYRDPIRTYDHDFGCAVIGASFYDPARSNWPAEYRGKFFFGDFCEGWIDMLDPETGAYLGRFADGIDRVVNLFTLDNGDLLYTERRGLGGGSTQDNTSTNNGRLWRIFYTGSGAPVISSNPRDVLVSFGEVAQFTVNANGSDPLKYTWYLDDSPVGNNEATLKITSALDMDGQEVYCIVSNQDGTDTSTIAILSVTDNQRPVPTISMPSADYRYRAGDFLSFSGEVLDSEDGLLDESSYEWRIDFHHADHTHPALSGLHGVASSQIYIPEVGEISPDVWYRIYLSATDSEGLRGTSYIDVFPVLTTITVDTEPSGLKMNVDGRNVTTPYSFESVVGIFHAIEAPITFIDGETFYGFEDWYDGDTTRLKSFLATEEEQSFTARFLDIELGKGTGLLGLYHKTTGPAFFIDDPRFHRVDSIIDFQWGFGSPDEDLIEGDEFHVLWSGELEALFTGWHDLYISSDDGSRLYIDDELLIDNWNYQAEQELSARVWLEAGMRYKIRLEYFEGGGLAAMRFSWRSDLLPKSIVPSTQLYPSEYLPPESGFAFRESPSLVEDEINISSYAEYPVRMDFKVFTMDGREALVGEWNIGQFYENNRVDVSELPQGKYFLVYWLNGNPSVFPFVKI